MADYNIQMHDLNSSGTYDNLYPVTNAQNAQAFGCLGYNIVTDLNNFTTLGVFVLTDSTITDRPSGSAADALVYNIGYPYSGTTPYLVQHYIDHSTSIDYQRYCFNSTWSAWTKVSPLTATDVGALPISGGTVTGSTIGVNNGTGDIASNVFDTSHSFVAMDAVDTDIRRRLYINSSNKNIVLQTWTASGTFQEEDTAVMQVPSVGAAVAIHPSSTACVRNNTISTATASGGTDGDTWDVYTA